MSILFEYSHATKQSHDADLQLLVLVSGNCLNPALTSEQLVCTCCSSNLFDSRFASIDFGRRIKELHLDSNSQCRSLVSLYIYVRI